MSQAKPVLLTPRLRLDALTLADTDVLHAYRSDPEVSRYQGWMPSSVDEVTAFISTQQAMSFPGGNAWCQWAVRPVDGHELLGDIGLHMPADPNDACEFGVTLRPEAQGRGIAREAATAVLSLAFGALGYRRAVASVDPRNTPSMTLLAALGFRQEAHHVESYLFRDTWVDDVVFAMLAREWAELRATALNAESVP